MLAAGPRSGGRNTLEDIRKSLETVARAFGMTAKRLLDELEWSQSGTEGGPGVSCLSLFIYEPVRRAEVKPRQSVSNIFTFIIKLYIYTIDP